MALSKLFINGVTILVLFSSFACKSNGVELKNILKCLERLTPCQPFLKSPRLPPSCCDPLKKLMTGDPTCPCAVYDNDNILKSFNMTKLDAYQLPLKCGLPPPDTSRCKGINGNGNGTTTNAIVVKVKEKNSGGGNVLVFSFTVSAAVMLCSTILLLL